MTDTTPTYPLMESDPDGIQAASGRPLSQIRLDADSGALTIDDLTIHAETLRKQAQVAQEAGHAQLAANLRRAAELTAVPRDEILYLYTMLRPRRASYQQLTDLADQLESTYNAAETARFIRQAAAAYQARGLLKPA
jgi:propanediol dehydratase small subunit